MRKDDLISDGYASLNAEMHRDALLYGTSGYKWSKLVRLLRVLVSAATFLDYGCGKQTLAQSVPELKITPYDPAIPGLDILPTPHDVVACTDVLEHIEPEKLANVLQHIAGLTKKVAFFAVSTRQAKRVMPDGRNAHLNVQTSKRWLKLLARDFNVVYFHDYGAADEFLAIVVPKKKLVRRVFLRAVLQISFLSGRIQRAT